MSMRQLIVITSPDCFPEEGQVLTRLFEAGMQRLHLRKPKGDRADLCRILDDLPAAYHPQVVLHDHFELAAMYSLGGVHLNQRNPHAPDGFQGSISRSCHSFEELEQYQSLDYLFLSPIFQSISKEGYGNGFTPEALQEASAKGIIRENVIALGGIDLNTLPLLHPYPFGGVAVLGALWGNHPSIQQTNSIVSTYIKLQAHEYVNRGIPRRIW